MIRKANLEDLETITLLAKKTREHMLASGLKQWVDNYPAYENFLSDYQKSGLYVYEVEGEILASISILPENDLPYKELKWSSSKALVIHRILVNPNKQKSGIGKSLFEYAINLGFSGNYESIKVDTHPDNLKMQNLIKKMGFEYRGFLTSIYRLAYELVLK